MSVQIAVQLDAVQALAEELRLLAAELVGEADQCRSAAASLGSALGDIGGPAVSAGTGWAGLLEAVAEGAGAVATTLAAAVVSYRAADAAVSDRLLAGRHGLMPVPR